jgi:hypothetical protein
MEHDCFAILGLTPGPYTPELIVKRFSEQRSRCLERLSTQQSSTAERRLEALHIACQLLSDPQRQQRHLMAVRDGMLADPQAHLRDLVAAAIEDGLLRYSRRQELLRIGREMGLSAFQVHLIIAEEQVGQAQLKPRTTQPAKTETTTRSNAINQTRLNFAAAGLLALGLFFMAISWLGI